ncbi:phage tail sheath subtilisin-like domain-containing protein [Mycolicibacterium rufum]|uniref:Phage tail sheath subtilisin-like domain-containing protein n=1 Tax=Mycolicibacterium rufum TaxID=318424 RepID=A0ABY3UIE7_9MYCO|nr:phage tail sheath C-terminal domain-containing protein [Mycolicibacterium rufum]ULP37986.1 phage tail sheath subtilisin-like domain-containing protein [Mycolicibacterium rufum]
MGDPVHLTSFADYQAEFGGLVPGSDLSYAVYHFYQNGGSEAEVVRVVHTGDNDDTKNAKPAEISVPGNAGNVVLQAASPGAWGNKLRVRVEANPADAANSYNLAVRDTGSGATESYLNVSKDPASASGLANLLANSGLIRVKSGDNNLPTPHEAINPADNLPDPFDDAKPNRYTKATDNSGTAGAPPTSADYLGDVLGKTGMYQLLKTDIFNMLCLPGFAGNDTTGVITAALKLCVDRRAMLIADSPTNWTTVASAATPLGQANFTLSGTDARNAAMYFPRIKAPDPAPGQNGLIREFAACGAVAGVWARTDVARGVWKAPAGTDASLSGVTGTTVKMTDLENGRLNPLGLNCLRELGVIGNVVWGARTRRGADQLADQWKYIPVRRLALFIEETLYRGTQWVVFEPNDEPLWSSIRLNVGAFMNTLFRQGAFQGRTPADAYLVKCDATNNPQNDIDRGIVNILVGFAPLKPAEFVVIRIQQLAGQIQV